MLAAMKHARKYQYGTNQPSSRGGANARTFLRQSERQVLNRTRSWALYATPAANGKKIIGSHGMNFAGPTAISVVAYAYTAAPRNNISHRSQSRFISVSVKSQRQRMRRGSSKITAPTTASGSSFTSQPQKSSVNPMNKGGMFITGPAPPESCQSADGGNLLDCLSSGRSRSARTAYRR